MSEIWSVFILCAFVFAAFLGRMPQLLLSVTDGAKGAVEFIISICGVMCFWSGMMEIMSRSGLSQKIARLVRPAVCLLFGKKTADDPVASEALSANITSNLLGLANASTPMGLRAAERIYELYGRPEYPPHALMCLVVLNTASLQILPTTVASVRASLGASDPYGILIPVWIASAVSVFVGIASVKLCGRIFGGREKT